jgi:hypothetical protein
LKAGGRARQHEIKTLLFVASGGHRGAAMNRPDNPVAMNAALAKKAVLVLNREADRTALQPK